MSVYLIDIDGTICFTNGNDYPNSIPVYNQYDRYFGIDNVNKLYDAGHTIKMFTSRGTTSGKDWRALTEKQLKEWGVKYHALIMGKPSCDFIVDDRAIKELP